MEMVTYHMIPTIRYSGKQNYEDSTKTQVVRGWKEENEEDFYSETFARYCNMDTCHYLFIKT